jgi:hypothetical protein
MKTINRMSLDAGHENCKVYLDGRKNVSLVAIAEAPLYGGVADDLSSSDGVYTFGGIKYYVGNNNYAKNNALSVRIFEKYASLMPLLIYRELELAGVEPDENNQIIIKSFRTGVPLSQYNKRDFLMKILKPDSGGFIVNGIEIILQEVKIGVQGLVAPLVFFGNKIPKGLIVVVEIGSKTTEVLTIERGKIINDSAYSKSINRGMNNAYLPLKPYLETKFGREFTEAQIADAFRKKYVESRGVKHDIEAEVIEVTKTYARQLVDEQESSFAKAFDDAQNILLCGGGAYNQIVSYEIKSRFGFERVLTLSGGHEFINARGYDLA